MLWYRILSHKEKQMVTVLNELMKENLTFHQLAEMLQIHVKTVKQIIFSLTCKFPHSDLIVTKKEVYLKSSDQTYEVLRQIYQQSELINLLKSVFKNEGSISKKSTALYRRIDLLNSFLSHFKLYIRPKDMRLEGDELIIRQLFLKFWEDFPFLFEENLGLFLIEETFLEKTNFRFQQIIAYRQANNHSLCFSQNSRSLINKEFIYERNWQGLERKDELIYKFLYEYSTSSINQSPRPKDLSKRPILKSWLILLQRLFPQLSEVSIKILDKKLRLETSKLVIFPIVYENDYKIIEERLQTMPRVKKRLKRIVSYLKSKAVFNSYSRERLLSANFEILDSLVDLIGVEVPFYIRIDTSFATTDQERIVYLLKYHFAKQFNLIFLKSMDYPSDKISMFIRKKDFSDIHSYPPELILSVEEINSSHWIGTVKNELVIWSENQKTF